MNFNEQRNIIIMYFNFLLEQYPTYKGIKLETRHLLRLKGISDRILNRRLNEVLLKFEIDQFPVYEFGNSWGNDLNAELMRLDPDENGNYDFSKKLPPDDQTFYRLYKTYLGERKSSFCKYRTVLPMLLVLGFDGLDDYLYGDRFI